MKRYGGNAPRDTNGKQLSVAEIAEVINVHIVLDVTLYKAKTIYKPYIPI